MVHDLIHASSCVHPQTHYGDLSNLLAGTVTDVQSHPQRPEITCSLSSTSHTPSQARNIQVPPGAGRLMIPVGHLTQPQVEAAEELP